MIVQEGTEPGIELGTAHATLQPQPVTGWAGWLHIALRQPLTADLRSEVRSIEKVVFVSGPESQVILLVAAESAATREELRDTLVTVTNTISAIVNYTIVITESANSPLLANGTLEPRSPFGVVPYATNLALGVLPRVLVGPQTWRQRWFWWLSLRRWLLHWRQNRRWRGEL